MTRPANPELRETIIAEAEKVVRQRGHEALNMRELAKAVGITATTIYNYFASKTALIMELRVRAAERLNVKVARAEAAKDPHEAIPEVGRRYIEFAEERPNEYRLIFEEIDEEPLRLGDEEKAIIYHTYYVAREALQRLKDTGGHLVDPAYGAMLGWIMLHGFSSLLISGRLELAEGLDRDTLRRAFLDAYAGGGFAGTKHESPANR